MPPIFFFHIFLVIVWLYFFLRRPDTRKEMLLIGLFALLFSPLFILLGHQELAGAIAISDLLFSFCVAGIAAVVFESVLGRHYRRSYPFHLPIKNKVEHWFLRLLLAATVWSWLSILLLFVMRTDALQSIVGSGLIIGSYIVASRRDLFWNALWSGLLMAVVFFAIYFLAFITSQPSETVFYFFFIPVDALVWSMTLGFVLGPMYEFARGYTWKGHRR